MNKRSILVLGVVAVCLIWSGANAQQGSSDDWRGPVDGVEVQMPTAMAPVPLPAPGQETPLMYGPGGAEALLNAIRRAQMPEGQERLLQFQPQQNTIDGSPPAAPPLGANFTGPGFGGIWTPGDPVIAAGSTHVGVMINSQCDFYTKAGVWSGGSVLKVFFAPVYDSLNCRDPFDPKIIFDHHANKWVMLALTYCSASQKSYYLIAVSQTINPLGLWWLWALDVMDPLEPNPLWADYPGLGFDADSGVYITSNQYAFGGGFNYAKIRALRKGALYSGTAIWWDYWGMIDFDGSTTFTIKPAHTFGNPGVEYLVNSKWAGGNTVDVWSLLPGDPFPANLGAVGIGWYFPPPIPPCSDSGLNLFDCRTQDAQYRNNHLYTSFHEEWDWGTGVKAVVRFLKIDIPNMAAAIDERYGHPDYHYFFPSIYSAPNDNIVTVFNRCGYAEIQEFISARYSARFLTQGDVASRASLYLQAGQAWYGDWANPNRWGDYSGIAYDPFQFCTMWIYSMYAMAPYPPLANWGTWIGSVFTHPLDTLQNHFKTWRIEPETFSESVFVEDQFMSDTLILEAIEFFSNPVSKDSFEIVDSLEHLTWYRAQGRDTLLEVEYSNQFGTDTVRIDSVKYLLLPTAKEYYPFPESLDHYKAYRIKDPVAFDRVLKLEDQFDLLYGEPEFIDSLKPIYFLTPALKNMPPPMFDSITHYVAYEIFPKRFFPLPVITHDQFGDHFLQVDTSKILLVPTTKLRAEPPPPPDTLRNHYKTWWIEPQTFDNTVFVQDQFMEDSLDLVEIQYLSNPVKKMVDSDTFDIISPDEHLTWYRAQGRNTLLEVEYQNQFELATVLIDSVKYLLLPTAKEYLPTAKEYYPFSCDDAADVNDDGMLTMADCNYLIAFLYTGGPPPPPPFPGCGPDPTPDGLGCASFPPCASGFIRGDVNEDGVITVADIATCVSGVAFPESLDHYKAYRIKDPVAFDRVLELEDQFDSLFGEPEFIDSLKPIYFLTPALKNTEQPQLFDSITHYVAYEIFPERFFPLTVTTFDQFGEHVLQVDTSKILLVPTTKLRAEPPPPDTLRNHFKTWRIEPQTFDSTVFVQDQFMEDNLSLFSLEYISNPVKKVVENDTFDIIRPDDHLTWYGAFGRDTSILVGYANQFETATRVIDFVEYLLVPTQKLPHAPPESLDHYKAYHIQGTVEFPFVLSLEDQFDIEYGSPEFIEFLTPRYFLTPAIKNMEQPEMFDSVTHYVAYEISPTRYFPLSVDTWDQFGSHVLDIQESWMLLVPTTKLKVCQLPNIGCPADETQNQNGVYTTTTQWTADDGNPADPSVELISVAVQPPLPPGISAANVNFAGPVPGPGLGVKSTWGTVTYTVADHCQPGGSITLIVTNNCPPPINSATCTFNVTLTNDPPDITQPDFLEGFVDDTVEYEITGTDPNGDVINDTASITIVPGCGTYSITRTAGHGTSSGTWQITWYTDTCAVCDTHMVIHDLTDGCDTSYCTTWVHLSERRECDPNDPYDCDTLWVECGNMRVPPGGGLVTIDLTIANDETLTAIVVPLSYQGNPTCCDSMIESENTVEKVFAGSIVEDWDIKVVGIDHQAKKVLLGAVPIAPPDQHLPPGKGHFATLTFFGDSCCTILLDTTLVSPNNHVRFQDTSATLFYPVCRIDTCHIERNNPPIIEQPDFLEGYVDSVVEYTITGIDYDGDVIRDSASIDIQPGCGSGYSITRISGHGTHTGTWEITWYTDGCSPCDTHMVIHDLTDTLGATAYCTTWVHLVRPESLYWKPPYEDYAPSGMPDIDQKQDGWLKTEQWSFCGPCAVANCFMWFDSKYNVPPGGPGDGSDQFPLVRDYLDNNPPWVGFDDHDPLNVDHTATPWNPGIGPPPPTPQPFVPGPQTPNQVPSWGELVERLAYYFNTDGIQTGYCDFTGTRVDDMQAGIDAWLESETFTDGSSLFDSLCEVTTKAPTFAYVESLVEKCEDVILLLGFWFQENPQEFIRGDLNQDGIITVADLVLLLQGPPYFCDDAADINDDGTLNRDSDSTYLWNYFYVGGPPPPPPFPDCGPDPTSDPLFCAEFPGCPPPSGEWRRIGGHYVTVAGVNSETYRIAFSDPFIDAAEFGAPGRVGNGTLIPHSFPHDPTVHNDEGNVSHDIFTVDPTSVSPGGVWWLPDYAINGDPGWWSWNFYAQNIPDEFVDSTQEWNGASQIFTEVEYCVHISPWDYRGDVNGPGGDGIINSADIVFLINYLFKGGPAPIPLSEGDVNCDGIINSADVVFLINYLFKGGPIPRCCDP